MPKNEIGSWFEDFIWKELQASQARTKPTPLVHKFVDSKTARGFVSAQPSDFLITYKLGTVYLEVKASEKQNNLPLSMIRDQQIAHARLVCDCNNAPSPHPYQVLFFSEPQNTVTFWAGHEIAAAKAKRRKLEAKRSTCFELTWHDFELELNTTGLIDLLNW